MLIALFRVIGYADSEYDMSTECDEYCCSIVKSSNLTFPPNEGRGSNVDTKCDSVHEPRSTIKRTPYIGVISVVGVRLYISIRIHPTFIWLRISQRISRSYTHEDTPMLK